MKKKKEILKKYKREEKRHDRVAEKETSRHEKKHKEELTKALSICEKGRKRK